MSAAGLAELGLSLPAAPAAAQSVDVEMGAEEVPKAAPQTEKDLYTQVGSEGDGTARGVARRWRWEGKAQRTLPVPRNACVSPCGH